MIGNERRLGGLCALTSDLLFIIVIGCLWCYTALFTKVHVREKPPLLYLFRFFFILFTTASHFKLFTKFAQDHDSSTRTIITIGLILLLDIYVIKSLRGM